jgi:hypothetical protein
MMGGLGLHAMLTLELKRKERGNAIRNASFGRKSFLLQGCRMFSVSSR